MIQDIDLETGEIMGANMNALALSKYAITPTGLRFNSTLSFDEWIACGSQLVGIKNAIQWCIGDWLAYGEGRGEWGEMYAKAMDATHISYDSLTAYTYVAQSFQFLRRRKNLSFSHHREIAPIEDELEQDRILNWCEETQASVTDLREYLKQFKNSLPHVAHNSGENEWYTPAKFIEAARQTMGGIDLDPASNPTANQIVKADHFYTKDDDGLKQDWTGRVWLNPPYSQPEIDDFSKKAVYEYRNGSVEQLCILVNNATETAWFQGLLNIASAVCLIRGRVKFLNQALDPEGAPLQGQVVLYVGHERDEFLSAFQEFGTVLYAE